MLHLKMPELHYRVSVLEHELCFPAMTLGSTELYKLYDSDSTRGDRSEDNQVKLQLTTSLCLLFRALPLEMIKRQREF